jgi:hypothetical protein
MVSHSQISVLFSLARQQAHSPPGCEDIRYNMFQEECGPIVRKLAFFGGRGDPLILCAG